MDKNKIQNIIDYAYPKIQSYFGKNNKSIPTVELHKDIYARLSGDEEAEGEHSSTTKAEYDDETNIIYIYYPNMMNEEDVIRSVLHEFEHTHQDAKKNEKYREQGYDDNPYEIAARKAEKKWKQYL